MATLTVQDAAETGGHTLSAAAGGGDQFKNDGRTFLLVLNEDASGITVTVTAQATAFSDALMGPATKSDGGGAVAAGKAALFGPFKQAAFNDSSGFVQVTYSAVTSVTVAAIKM